jgi:hypothetical protein
VLWERCVAGWGNRCRLRIGAETAKLYLLAAHVEPGILVTSSQGGRVDMKRFAIDVAVIVLAISLSWGYSTAWSHPASARHSLALLRFVGNWTFHDGRLAVNRQGRGSESFRTFVDCTATIQTACDKFQGNFIYNGGFVTFTLNKIGGNQATGQIDNSAYSWAVFTPITLIFNPAKDTLRIRSLLGASLACGPKAPPGMCGA